MKTIRTKFVEEFGESQARRIERAAESHGNGINNKNKGSDPFKWALLICLGYQCVEVARYKKYHGITIGWGNFKKWIKNHGELGSHDGDCDYLALFCGTYNEFIKS